MIAESAMAAETVALAQQQEDLLDAAVREHARLVYRIANSVLRNLAEAEDAAQEVFLRVLRCGKKADSQPYSGGCPKAGAVPFSAATERPGETPDELCG